MSTAKTPTLHQQKLDFKKELSARLPAYKCAVSSRSTPDLLEAECIVSRGKNRISTLRVRKLTRDGGVYEVLFYGFGTKAPLKYKSVDSCLDGAASQLQGMMKNSGETKAAIERLQGSD